MKLSGLDAIQGRDGPYVSGTSGVEQPPLDSGRVGNSDFAGQLQVLLGVPDAPEPGSRPSPSAYVPRSAPEWTPELDNLYRWSLLDPSRAPEGLRFSEEGRSTSNDIYRTYYEITPYQNIMRYDILVGPGGTKHVTFIPNPEPRLVHIADPVSDTVHSSYTVQHSAYQVTSRAFDHPSAAGPPSWFVPGLSDIWLENALKHLADNLIKRHPLDHWA